MAGTFLGKYDTTAANNSATGTGAVSVAEGMLPSNINNAFRSVMADIRQHYNELNGLNMVMVQVLIQLLTHQLHRLLLMEQM